MVSTLHKNDDAIWWINKYTCTTKLREKIIQSYFVLYTNKIKINVLYLKNYEMFFLRMKVKNC